MTKGISGKSRYIDPDPDIYRSFLYIVLYVYIGHQIETTIELEEDVEDFSASLLEMSQGQSRVYLVYAK